MEKAQLEQILKSDLSHEILYENRPIWVEDYNPKRGVARVKNLDSEEVNVVSVTELQNTGKVSENKH